MKVQLLTFPGCPYADVARDLLQRVLASSGVPIEEVDTTAANIPESLLGWGSPTILVDGMDVGGQEAPGGASCRLYRDEDGNLRGVPSEGLLRSVLDRTTEGRLWATTAARGSGIESGRTRAGHR